MNVNTVSKGGRENARDNSVVIKRGKNFPARSRVRAAGLVGTKLNVVEERLFF